MSCPLICHLAIGAKYDVKSWMQGVEFGDSSGAEACSIVMNLLGVGCVPQLVEI